MEKLPDVNKDIEEKFNTYLSKYCFKHEISPEEAQKHVIVQNYKDYLIKEAAGKINDQRNIDPEPVPVISCNCC